MEKTTLYLPADLHRSYRDLARRLGRSQAALMREALVQYAGDRQSPPLRSLGIVDRFDVPAADIDDWLHANWHPDEDERAESGATG
jgi:predicted transcriptional regulator